jgi:hypothetical protein
MGVVLGSDPTDPQVLGVRMGDMLPGRGHLVRRNQRNLVQIAYLASDTLVPWVTRLVQAAAFSKRPVPGTHVSHESPVV